MSHSMKPYFDALCMMFPLLSVSNIHVSQNIAKKIPNVIIEHKANI